MAHTLPSSYVPDKVRAFIDSLAYAREEYKDALTGILSVSHARDAFTTVPHLLVTGKTPGSGKSTMSCDIPMLLAFNPWKVGKLTTEPSIRNKYIERVRPNPVADDIGKIFGDNGTNGKGNIIYALLIDCYRNDGTVSVSRSGANMDLPSFGVAFMNGLQNAVPNDLFTRAIWMESEEAPSGIVLRDALEPGVKADARIIREALHAWSGSHAAEMTAFMRGPVRFIHPALEKRKRQIWGPVFAFAAAAGGDWPRRIYDAFVSIALDAGDKPVPMPEQRLLLDAADIIMRRELEAVFASDLMAALRARPEGHYYREVDDAHLIQRLFPETFGASKMLTGKMLLGDHAGEFGRAKGYDAAEILSAAADLREVLYPPMEHIEDDTEKELAFMPIGVPK